jgi:hypothetical protein
MIAIVADGVGAIRYTTDGTEPSLASLLYSKPFSIHKTAIVKAKAFLAGSLPSAVASEKVIKYEWKNALGINYAVPGIRYQYFEPSERVNLSLIGNTPVVKSGVTGIMDLSLKDRKDRFAFEFSGYIKIEKDGVYNFFTRSDDGSKLFIDDEEIVNNDDDHGNQERTGKALLKKGFHKIRVLYFDSGGDNNLEVLMQPENGRKETLPAKLLFH